MVDATMTSIGDNKEIAILKQYSRRKVKVSSKTITDKAKKRKKKKKKSLLKKIFF